MRTTEILPEVSVINAILLFRRFGIDVTGMTVEALREVRRQLIHRHHPDRGGNLDTAQSINAAFDLLKDGVPKYRGSPFALGSFRRTHQNRGDQLAALKLCYPEYPEWRLLRRYSRPSRDPGTGFHRHQLHQEVDLGTLRPLGIRVHDLGL